MQQLNVRTKKYMGRNDRFADLCNYYLFHGEPVIQPESLVEKDVTELGTVLEFCQCSNDKMRMRKLIQGKKEEGVRLEKEAYDMLTECFKVGVEELKEEGEKIDVCKAFEDWAAEERAEGRAEGEERLGKLICVLLSQSKVEEAKKVAEDVGVRKEYYTLYNI